MPPSLQIGSRRIVVSIMESRYVSKVTSHDFPSSSFKSITLIGNTTQQGMHNVLAVKSLLTSFEYNSVVDILYRFELPHSCYVDVNEIEV